MGDARSFPPVACLFISKRGFTLLELLIVVIIVAILAAAALPQFSRMMIRARVAEPMGTIGDIMTAEMAYYQEYAAFTTFANNAAAGAALNLDLPADASCNWDYSVTAVASPIKITASGDTGAVTTVIKTGTLANDGTRVLPNA